MEISYQIRSSAAFEDFILKAYVILDDLYSSMLQLYS